MKKYSLAKVGGSEIRVVSSDLFYKAPTISMGYGLFCAIDLVPGDVWWAHDIQDPRYVRQCYSWDEYESMPIEDRKFLQKQCYVDTDSRSLILCAEPFSRVNHGNQQHSNSTSDIYKNSIASKSISSNSEIFISYDYEAIVSLIWKFENFKEILPKDLLKNENFLFRPASEIEIAMDFLNGVI